MTATSSNPARECQPGTASQWQPIETAPKDGTKFWAYQRSRGQFECRWYNNWPHEAYWMDNNDSEPEPTNWQPLPLPPPPEAI